MPRQKSHLGRCRVKNHRAGDTASEIRCRVRSHGVRITAREIPHPRYHQTQSITPMLAQCRDSVGDVGPALSQHWVVITLLSVIQHGRSARPDSHTNRFISPWQFCNHGDRRRLCTHVADDGFHRGLKCAGRELLRFAGQGLFTQSPWRPLHHIGLRGVHPQSRGSNVRPANGPRVLTLISLPKNKLRSKLDNSLYNELVREQVSNKFQHDTWKTWQVIMPTRRNFKAEICHFVQNISNFAFFQPYIKLFRKLSNSSIQDKFKRDTWKSCYAHKEIMPTRKFGPSRILTRTNRKVALPVTWRDQPINGVMQLPIKLGDRKPYLD